MSRIGADHLAREAIVYVRQSTIESLAGPTSGSSMTISDVRGALEQLVDRKVALEDEVAAVLDLRDGIEAGEVDRLALPGGEFRPQQEGPVVETLADDVRAQPVGGGLQGSDIVNREKRIVVLAEADLRTGEFHALSYEHAGKVEAQLKAEVADLMAKAEAADAADIPDGMSIPDELARREERLRKLAEARAKIEARAKERHAREQAEHEARLAARQAKAEASGKKPRGKPPDPPVEGPRPNDQINLTDEESRIMPVAGGGFDQCYNAQAAVAAGSLLVVASAVSQAPNDSSNSNRCWTRSRLLPTN